MKPTDIEKENLKESSLSRIYSHVKNRSFGMISASRSENTSAENKQNTLQLKSLIRANGFGFVNAKGSYIENLGTENEVVISENSFIVIGGTTEESSKTLLSFLIAAGKTFNQESIFFKPFNDDNGYLYFMNNGYKSLV